MMRLVLAKACLFVALLEVGCVGDNPDSSLADLGDSSDDLAGGPGQSDMGTVHNPARTYLLKLEAGAFPQADDHPSALVYLPEGFDPTPPVSLLVYIHGFNNCVENIVRPTDDAKPCTEGGPPRNAYNLIGQLEAAGKKAILLCPEVAFDKSSGDPGKLGNKDGFRDLLVEALSKLQEPLHGLEVAGIDKVAVASHSGGYVVASSIARQGGVSVDELWLLDSLYGLSSDFEAWIREDLNGLSGAMPRRRFAVMYTDTGGTLANSQALATRAASFITDASVLIDDRTTATWPLATYYHGLLFKHSMLTHDGVPRYYFQNLVATSSLK